MLISKKRSLNGVLASPSQGNAATKIPRGVPSHRQPFKSPVTGEIGSNLPLNATHPTGPRAHRLNGTQLEAMDPFEMLMIPDSAKEIYKTTRKIEKLYDWQKECLSDRRLISGSNFILSLPTGSGKTLVAELLMLKCLLQNKQDCIIILPFVAIVQEKAISLAIFEEPLGFTVEEYAGYRGRIPPHKRRGFVPRLFICTIEKANILVNSLVVEKRLNEIGLVIVDELHMLGELRRGTILEQCLTKIMVVNSATQIIGMSATLSSVEQIRRFLRAHLYTTEFRPLPLHEFVKIDNKIHRLNEPNGELEYVRDLPQIVSPKIDTNGIIPLVAEVIPNKSVLIFCQTKRNTEDICKLLARTVPNALKEYKKAEKGALIQQILDSNEGAICPIMRSGIEAGVAYHNSGLTREERNIIENGFRDGTLYVMCATSTLAAGVNLPARRVIIRRFKIGRDVMSKSYYMQMIGRAGRAGLDSYGESILMIQGHAEREDFNRVRFQPLPECKSGMLNADCLEAFVLDLIALKICETPDHVQEALRYTMLENDSEGRQTVVTDVVQKLMDRQMINENFELTDFGLATSRSSIKPSDAILVYNELKRTLDTGLILSSHFHMLCIIVPYDIELYTIDFQVFIEEYNQLSQGEKLLLKEWGIDLGYITNCFLFPPKLKPTDHVVRVYIALMLQRLWSTQSIAEIAERFNVSRGWLNNIVQLSCSHASQLVRFTTEITTFWAYRNLLPELLERLHMCSQKELTQLLAIDCVKRKRAQMLFDAGYRSVGAVARATPDELVAKIAQLGRPQAIRIITSAKFVFRHLIEEKAEEMELIGANESDIPPLFIDDFSSPIRTPQMTNENVHLESFEKRDSKALNS
ncbi:hypothetical protein M3Y98_00892100 [Aphelenchoides besseyi]|nr:hypothetical protein M3Y98_00892100 [Aphelenchoides besseyi]KAI6193004.1 hypothetical protein M3Y96_00972200 [Aphelenchoides besseyi]